MVLVLLACADPPPPSPVVVPAAAPPAAPAAVVRTLRGRAVAGTIVIPALDEGAALLGPGCAAANAKLHAKGTACSVEAWAGEGGDTRWFWRAGARAGVSATPDGPVRRARASWPRLGHILAGCLDGDPLALPPAGDPGGARAWVADAWVITLTGENACGLGGQLRLDVSADHADWSAVLVDGVAWERGGREMAERRQLDRVVAAVQAGWDTMDARAQDDAIVSLAHDPRTAAVAAELSARRTASAGRAPPDPAPAARPGAASSPAGAGAPAP